MMSELGRAFVPGEIEDDLYADWVASGCFHAEPDDDGEPFSIVIPPPNVTGSLHIGHALDNTIQDALVRRARMQGRNAVWIPGTDHAGIATQMVVERQLAAEGLTRHDLGREAFVERVWRWREDSGGRILDQLRRLGCSLDWDREVFTLDAPRNEAVTKVFVELYEQGLIYRGNRLINWDPVLHTALSDIEVEHEEVTGTLTTFRYPLADADGHVEVATTRPETMLGDTAVAVHPDDERYGALVGREVAHPFLDRRLPIVADDHVDPEFGTGAVKITPAHDHNDYELGLRHDLPMISMLDPEGRVTADGGDLEGLDRFEAREEVVRRLDAAGLLVARDPHVHQVGHSERSKAVVEPMLSDQWFVSVRPLADKAVAAVRSGEVRFVPERMTGPFLDWLDGLRDWCISRQLWWGHRIPAWFHEETGEIRVATTAPDGPGWEQDPDVLDTWFSSQLWPLTVFGWPRDTAELRTWFPTSVLVTGYDINTFWVSRMLMISQWLLDVAPFEIVHNHGLVRAQSGRKMSKSFGNAIDPLELVDEHGADATRLALVRSAAPGTDVPLAREWVEGERKFANKLWNVVAFALRNDVAPAELPDDLALEDRWVLSRLEAARAAADGAYDAYEWPGVVRALRGFAWDELADWYVEVSKVRLHGDDEAAAATARAVLFVVVEQLLRLLHPLAPFVTERLWRALTDAPGGRDSLMLASWPTAATRDHAAEDEFAVVQDLVTEVRRFRSQHDVRRARRLDLTVSSSVKDVLVAHLELVRALCGLGEVTFVEEVPDDPTLAKIVFAHGEATTPLRDLVDVEAELARLERELESARERERTAEGRLANDAFVDNAPEPVVTQERERLAASRRRIDELTTQVTTLRAS